MFLRSRNVQKVWIHPEVLDVKFACDLARCKGACCTFPGGSGAPVDEDEIGILHQAFAAVRHLLPAEHRAIAERDGLFLHDGPRATLRCVNERACIFVMYDGEIAKCAIQHAHAHEGFPWVKPRSCYLFPIRMRRNGYTLLEYERFTECAPALERGKSEDIPLLDFLEKPLRQEIGDEWYDNLREGSPGGREER